MGWVSNFLAKAVLEGFIFAVGFGLIVDQLPKILGIPKAEGSYWDVLVGVVQDFRLTNAATLAVGGAAVGILLRDALQGRRSSLVHSSSWSWGSSRSRRSI